jgi:hypothetical protein
MAYWRVSDMEIESGNVSVKKRRDSVFLLKIEVPMLCYRNDHMVHFLGNFKRRLDGALSLYIHTT